jgi:hypothetical protein
VSTDLFRDDDQGYTAGLASSARGYVLSIQRAVNPSDARVHHAGRLPGPTPRASRWRAGRLRRTLRPGARRVLEW